MSDYLIQKLPERGNIYHKTPGIWYSKTLKRWVVTSPELIRQAMNDTAFSVPAYDASVKIEKLGIELNYISEVRRWLPLAVEGAQHEKLREVFARHITSNINSALNILSLELKEMKSRILSLPPKYEFCLYSDFIKPILTKSVCSLADVTVPENISLEIIPQFFDDAISPTRMQKIDQTIAQLIQSMPGDLSHEQKYLRAAIISLSVNSIFASISYSIIQNLECSPTKNLAEVNWSEQLLRSGLPLVERKVVRDTKLGSENLTIGERLRLFVESDGVLPDGVYKYSDLFFAVGPHKCLGMSFSKQVWKQFSKFLSDIPRALKIIEIKERSGDYVFNFPTTIKVYFET